MPQIAFSAGTTVVSTNASAIASQPCTGCQLQGHISNTTVVRIGSSGSQTLHLSAGALVQVPALSNLNQLYAATSAGSALLTWLCWQADGR